MTLAKDGRKGAPLPTPIDRKKLKEEGKGHYDEVKEDANSNLKADASVYLGQLKKYMKDEVGDKLNLAADFNKAIVEAEPPKDPDQAQVVADLEEKLAAAHTKIADGEKKCADLEKEARQMAHFRREYPKEYETWVESVKKRKADAATKKARAKREYEESQQAEKDLDLFDGANERDNETPAGEATGQFIGNDYDANDYYIDEDRAVTTRASVLRDAIEKAQAYADALLAEIQNKADMLEHLQSFVSAHKTQFIKWKQRRAQDVWREVVAAQAKVDALVEEYEDLCVEDPADGDYVERSGDDSDGEMSGEESGDGQATDDE